MAIFSFMIFLCLRRRLNFYIRRKYPSMTAVGSISMSVRGGINPWNPQIMNSGPLVLGRLVYIRSFTSLLTELDGVRCQQTGVLVWVVFSTSADESFSFTFPSNETKTEERFVQTGKFPSLPWLFSGNQDLFADTFEFCVTFSNIPDFVPTSQNFSFNFFIYFNNFFIIFFFDFSTFLTIILLANFRNF